MKKPPLQAFTLIELLVVISIIAILAGIALPVFSEVQVRGAQTKALSNAKQIGLACKLYAADNNGSFPFYTDPQNRTGTANDANAILETLIPDYIGDKGVFSIGPTSAFCKKRGLGAQGDENKLRAGDNEWAYVTGLNDTSNARYPLLADGFVPGSENGDPSYTANNELPGGVWKGKKAVVIRVDTSGSVDPCYKPSGAVNAQTKYTVKRTEDRPKDNAFKKDPGGNPPWLSSTDIQVLNPLVPK